MTVTAESPTITGTHPYAEAWPLLDSNELDELAADIQTNGLRDSIVLYRDKILDGRNRQSACERAGVEPHYTQFDGDDDAALTFVQSVNNARRHQSKGSLAASWALSMLTAGKRTTDSSGSGRWAQGSQNSGNSKAETEMYRLCGVIADYSPDLLVDIRDDQLSLNAAYQQACEARDAERQKLEQQQRIEAEEADAKAFIESEAPELAAQVGDVFESYAEAQAVWEKRNREEAERRRKDKEAEQFRQQQEEKRLTRTYTGLAEAIQVLSGWGRYDEETLLGVLMGEYDPKYLYPKELREQLDQPKLADAQKTLRVLTEWSTQK